MLTEALVPKLFHNKDSYGDPGFTPDLPVRLDFCSTFLFISQQQSVTPISSVYSGMTLQILNSTKELMQLTV